MGRLSRNDTKEGTAYLLVALVLAVGGGRAHACAVPLEDADKEAHLVLAREMGLPSPLESVRALRRWERERGGQGKLSDALRDKVLPERELRRAWPQFLMDEGRLVEPPDSWLFDVTAANFYYLPGDMPGELHVRGRVIVLDSLPQTEDSPPERAISALFPDGRPGGLVIDRLRVRPRRSLLPHPRSFLFDAILRVVSPPREW